VRAHYVANAGPYSHGRSHTVGGLFEAEVVVADFTDYSLVEFSCLFSV
jgi:hypothetical protein